MPDCLAHRNAPPPTGKQSHRQRGEEITHVSTLYSLPTGGWWQCAAQAQRFLSLLFARRPAATSVICELNGSSERLFNCCLNSRDHGRRPSVSDQIPTAVAGRTGVRTEEGGRGRLARRALTAQCSAAKNKQWTDRLWLAGWTVRSQCNISRIRESNVRQTKTRTNI